MKLFYSSRDVIRKMRNVSNCEGGREGSDIATLFSGLLEFNLNNTK